MNLASAADLAREAQRRGAADLDALEVYLDRIDRFEPIVQAFAAFDADRVREGLARVDGAGRLAGTLVAIKDVMDTVDYPTEFFSPIHAGRRPAQDAWIVSRLKAEGAIVAGKTHTAEFAYSHTGPTRNPHDLQRTPGSSSAGSAAGVAAGFFPLALGTQTAGSTLKPASYCGVFGFKPTFGRVPLTGVLPHAPSFDTAGWFARSVRDLEILADVLLPGLGAVSTGAHGRLAWCKTPYPTELEVSAALSSAHLALMQAGWSMTDFELPPELSAVPADHVIVNEAEAARSLAQDMHNHPDLVSREVSEAIARAADRGLQQEGLARMRLYQAQRHAQKIFEQFDYVLAPTCGVVAPLGLGSTGSSDHTRLWTAFGLPLLSIPLPRSTGQLPVGLQLVGSPGTDRQLLEFAGRLSAILGSSCAEVVDPA